MPTTSAEPSECFPTIGTVENPSVFYDGKDVLLCYQVAPVDGGGVCILEFKDAFDFTVRPISVESLGKASYPARPWSFTEVFGTGITERGKVLSPRLWTISFNDELVEIGFQSVEIVGRIDDVRSPKTALARFISQLGTSNVS